MAGRYPETWLNELRQRADIVQTVSAYVPLKKNGRNYWGLCPFHGEKTASFSVNPEKQFYYCFGCKAGGSVIQFIMDIEHLEFGEAVALLAERVHMTLPELRDDPDYDRRKEQKNRLLAANREAAQYFHQTLFTPEGQPVLEYLKGRGLSDAVIRKFGLGAAPDRWDTLTRRLMDIGFTEEELRLAGLTVVHEAEEAGPNSPARPRRVFDMFRGRAMFPIIDQYGNVLAFGGRLLGKGQPKYLNTSDTPVFNKRFNVFAANLLKKERGLDRVILVEGYMDVVALSQFGVRGVCATLGTALTPEQARLLKRFAPKVYLSYDGDSAGQHAILRGLDVLAAENIPTRVLDFPDGLDPDEFIRRDGPEAFEKLPAVSPETYRIRRLAEQYNLSEQDGKIEFARACAPLLKSLDPVELEVHLQQLSVRTGFSREVLLAQIGITARQPAAQARPPKPKPSVISESIPDGQPLELVRAQETVISLLATGHLPKDIVSQEDFEDPLLKDLFTGLHSGVSPAALIESRETEADRARTARLMESPPTSDTNEMIRMVEQCTQVLRRARIEAQINTLQAGIPAMTEKEKQAAILQISSLTHTLHGLKPS